MNYVIREDIKTGISTTLPVYHVYIKDKYIESCSTQSAVYELLNYLTK